MTLVILLLPFCPRRYRHRLLHLRDQGKFPPVLVASIDGFKCIKRRQN